MLAQVTTDMRDLVVSFMFAVIHVAQVLRFVPKVALIQFDKIQTALGDGLVFVLYPRSLHITLLVIIWERHRLVPMNFTA